LKSPEHIQAGSVKANTRYQTSASNVQFNVCPVEDYSLERGIDKPVMLRLAFWRQVMTGVMQSAILSFCVPNRGRATAHAFAQAWIAF
jgi:hypothetical protein